MKELNETIKTILLEHKNEAYAIDEKCYGFTLGDEEYRQVTGVDLTTLSKICHAYGIVRSRKYVMPMV